MGRKGAVMTTPNDPSCSHYRLGAEQALAEASIRSGEGTSRGVPSPDLYGMAPLREGTYRVVHAGEVRVDGDSHGRSAVLGCEAADPAVDIASLTRRCRSGL